MGARTNKMIKTIIKIAITCIIGLFFILSFLIKILFLGAGDIKDDTADIITDFMKFWNIPLEEVIHYYKLKEQ